MRYRINAKTTLGDVAPTIVSEFERESDAIKYARETAKELYYLNPKRDILDIIREEKDIDEDTARIVFELEMIRNIIYTIEVV